MIKRVANKIPKPRLTAVGARNCAWMLRSKISGEIPRKVVSDVRKIGRNL